MIQEKQLERSLINRPTHTTLADQTVLAIQDAIKQGKFPAGSQLPPEMELLQMMGISRTTLREALPILEEQRFIRKRRGLGTFVMERAIVKDMSQNFGITEMISQAGYTPGTRDFMPQDYLGGWTPTGQNLNGVSLYECLERSANIRIVDGMASFSPVQANREVAEKLSIQRNALLLLIEQADHDQNQRPVLYSAEYDLTDKFNFIIHRKGPAF